MADNRGVVYMKPGVVEVQSIDFPKLALGKRKCDHGVILKILTTNICGSDQHMVRGRTTAPAGLVLGHEITGEVIEAGRGHFMVAPRQGTAVFGVRRLDAALSLSFVFNLGVRRSLAALGLFVRRRDPRRVLRTVAWWRPPRRPNRRTPPGKPRARPTQETWLPSVYASFESQRVNGIQRRRLARRIEAKKYTGHRREAERDDNGLRRHRGGPRHPERHAL